MSLLKFIISISLFLADILLTLHWFFSLIYIQFNFNLFLFVFQASHKRTLFSVSFAPEGSDKTKIEAKVMDGTKLCSRRLLKEIIYCVGGVSVFFPLLTRFDKLSTNASVPSDDRLAADVIDLVASVLDGNASNQQQMHLLSGFAILGFLFQSVTPCQLNMETLKSLKYMFSVLKGCGMYTRPINAKDLFYIQFAFVALLFFAQTVVKPQRTGRQIYIWLWFFLSYYSLLSYAK